VSSIQIHTVQRIVIKVFTVIPDSLQEVLVILLGNMSNILKFSDFYRNMLFISKHTIWYEDDIIYLRVPIITVCVSLLFHLFQKWKTISYTV